MDTLLIADDDLSLLESLKMHFEDVEAEGAPRFQVHTATTAGQALSMAAETAPSLVILDMMLPDRSGLDIIEELKATCGGAPIVIVTAYHDMETTIRAMKLGAYDYIHKPFADPAALDLVVDRALKMHQLSRRAATVSVDRAEFRLGDIVGNSRQIQQLVKDIGKVANASYATVLISGESGTGKELIARVIHNYSYDHPKPFVGINCSAIVDTLLESELFGHERGAFTGAQARRDGRFQQADGGTLFLDEIGEISPSTQVKLLRFLQEREFERVGGNQTIKVDVRIVAATNRDLQALVREGKFREDLFYRLNVVSIEMPPLRARPTDIPLLAMHFLRKYAAENEKPVRGFSAEALERLVRYGWPGNVRELENAIERAVVVCRGEEVGTDDLAPTIVPAEPGGKGQLPSVPGSTLAELEKFAILKTLEHTGGSTSKAAEMLGISPRKIQYRLREYSGAPGPRTGRARAGSEDGVHDEDSSREDQS